MKILDKYIGGRFLTTFFFILLLLLMISIVIDLTENLKEMVEEGTPFWPIVNYYLDFSPWIASLLAPLFVFISVIFFTSRLTNNSEIIATISGGVSFYRLLIPYLVAGFGIACLFFYANHFLIPNANADILEFKQTWLGKTNYTRSNNNIHLQLDENRILYLRSFNIDTDRGYTLEIETFEGNDVVYKLSARTIDWVDSLSIWRANDITERFLSPTHEELKTSRQKTLDQLNLLPIDFMTIKNRWTTLTTPELNKEIKRERMKGTDLDAVYQIEKHKRTSTPIAILIFTIMGVSIASRKTRGGTGSHLALGFLLSAMFFLLINFSETFAEASAISPIMSVWIPNILFTVVAIILVIRAQK